MKKFKVIATDFASPYIHVNSYLDAAANVTDPMLGLNEDIVLEYRGKDYWRFCIPEGGFDQGGHIVLEKLRDEKFFKEVFDKSIETAKAVEKYAAMLNKLNVAKLSNEELAMHYSKLYDLFVQMNAWGHVVNLGDFEHFMLSNKILSFLEKKVKETNSKTTAAEAFSILATPAQRSKLAQQDFDFYNLLAEMQASRPTKEVDAAISLHQDKFKWLQFHYDGPTILGEAYFREALESALRQGASGREKIKEILQKEKEVAARQKQLVNELKLSREEKHWLEVARAFAYLKGLRKETIFEANANYFPLLKEIAKRLELTPRQVRFMTIQEVQSALKGGDVDVVEINRRTQLCVTRFSTGMILGSGKEAREVSNAIYEEQASAETKELKGTPAYPGKVEGVVKIVVTADDMKKFKQGDILVSPATNPNLLPIMKIASAIVTDEGGITCHAAIVSRELGIPCVIGTRVATKWLKDGDKVSLDAVNGIIRKL